MTVSPSFPVDPEFRLGIYWITPWIAQGSFATPERGRHLLDWGVRYVLNVSEAPNELSPSQDGFEEVIWEPLEDVERMTDEQTIRLLETMHRILTQGENKLYIHCMAGQNRSATLLWLYMIACGLDPETAAERITSKNHNAKPGHHRLADEYLVQLVQWHGANQFQPLSRPEIVDSV